MAGKPPGEGRLEGWAAIAGYLGTSSRTAQRWEQELGLPVRHAGRSKGYRVFAFPADLDEWMKNTQVAAPTPGPPPSNSGPNLVQTVAAERAPHPRLRWLVLAGGAIAASAVLLVAVKTIRSTDVEVGQVRFSSQQLIASSNGRFLWSYDFGRPLVTSSTGQDSLALILSANQNHRNEVIVAAPRFAFDQPNGGASDALYAFSSSGKLLWRNAFNQHVAFAGENAGPPWEARTMASSGGAKSPLMWVALDSSLKSIALLLRVEPDGRFTTQFVNYGHLLALAELKTKTSAYLVAGGINNECDCAALAILPLGAPSGHSPQSPSLSPCHECPVGAPYRYFLFPRSEVDLLSGPSYNGVIALDLDGPRLQVMTYESLPAEPSRVADWALYEFREGFVPASAIFSDHYWDDHRRLSREGKISHPASLCPVLRQGLVVRGWSPETGWKDFQLPPVVAPPSSQYPSQRATPARRP
jgi:hypothetical protein